jgi:membrane protease YdiL (CAAX protease family)
MDQLSPDTAPITAAPEKPRRQVWKFWGTLLWGLFIAVAMVAGQIAAIIYFAMRREGPHDLASVSGLVGDPLTLGVSVIAGLLAVVAALWLAISFTRTSFADYLALRRPSWKHVLLGSIGLALIVGVWEVISRVTGHEVAPEFMIDVMKSARGGAVLLPLLIVAFCVAAPISEELFARGFLFRGWSDTALRPVGAILLSSAAWTIMHLQYDWFFLGEIFTIGVWLGFLRYRFHSIWPSIIVHGLNNLAAVIETMWLAGPS